MVADIAKEEAASKASGEADAKNEVLAPRKKACPFCGGKNEPHYYDAAALRRFLSDRGRIQPRSRSGVCSKHQRRVTTEIKRARHLALLPFTIQL